MQSGISASEDLHSAFKTLLNTPSERALLATISSESLVPHKTLPSSDSFDSDLDAIVSELQPNAALYILLRLPTSGAAGPPLAAITYLPDTAPVRQKMLFASSRLTLVRDLGTEHFAESRFCTSAEEMTPAGWKRHEAHADAEIPLTEEERNLADIKQAEALEQGGASRRGAGYGGMRSTMPVGDGVVDALKGLQPGDLVMLKIDPNENIVFADTAKRVVNSVSPGDLASQISKSEPRYSYYCHTYDDGSGTKTGVIFTYTCPSDTKIKDRMLYASSRKTAESVATKLAEIKLEKKIEATDPDEITAQTLEAEFSPPKEEKIGFAKPKRPGRR